MQKSYSTLIQSSQGYPFDIRDNMLPIFDYQIQIKLPLQEKSSHEYNKRFKKILDLQLLCSSLIKLNRIIDDRTQKEFILVYEFVPYSLEDIYDLKIQFKKIEAKANQICQFLLHKRIRPQYSAKNFGFTQNKELKYFLNPNFYSIQNQIELKQEFDEVQLKVKNLFKSLKLHSPINPRQTFDDDKNSQRVSERDLSAYNKKFEQKISFIESKLLQSKQGNSDKMSGSQKIKRRKKLSQNFTEQNISVSSSSSNSQKLIDSKSKGYEIGSQNSYKNEYQQRYSKTANEKYYIKSSAPLGNKSSSQQEHQSPQNMQPQKASKLTNSLIMEEKNEQMQKIKHHKSSFGDYSSYGNQSEKEKKLKKRISFALEKSQNALKVYEKYQSMRHPHHSNTKR